MSTFRLSRKFISCSYFGVLLAPAVYVPCEAQTQAPFHTLTLKASSFRPSALPGIPITTFTTDKGTFTRATIGYQSGDVVNGQILYYPWQVLPPGATGGMSGALSAGIPHGVIVSYKLDGTNFSDTKNWTFFDLTTLIQAPPDIAAGYNGAAIAGNAVYLVPAAANPYPVFVEYDASQPLDAASSYQFFPAPPRGGVLGAYYGWCGGVYDGRYVYYVPAMDQSIGTHGVHHGNVVRYDTTTSFNPDATQSGWSAFDMGSQVSPAAKGFQSAVYDGHRFLYFIPDTNHLLVRYDTQYHTPGTPDPSAFTTPAAYKVFDPTTLGSAGAPPYTGEGNTQNLVGFTGGVVVWDSAQVNEYLYLIPWAIYPGGAGGAYVPTLESTTARVLIGTENGSTWNYVDVTGTDTPPTAPPDWEIFDLNNLTSNPAWAANHWEAVYPLGPLKGQSTIAGFQLGWVNTVQGWPRAAFSADMSAFWVEHDVGHALDDPDGWYVARVPKSLPHGTMGGAYDAVNQVFYPSSPTGPLIRATGF